MTRSRLERVLAAGHATGNKPGLREAVPIDRTLLVLRVINEDLEHEVARLLRAVFPRDDAKGKCSPAQRLQILDVASELRAILDRLEVVAEDAPSIEPMD